MSETPAAQPESAAAKPRANMHPIVNLLVQLQELTLVRSEHEVSASGKGNPQLDQAIKDLLSQLPPEVRLLFLKSQKKDPLAIVPIANNVCSGCGLTLPVALVYAVRSGERLYQCTNCARILYYPDVRPRRIGGKSVRRSEPRRTGIGRFSAVSLMVPNLKAGTRDEAVRELASLMEQEKFVDDGAKLFQEALKREAILSTAVEHGMAFPHVRGVEGGGLTLALGISRKGIRFDEDSRNLTHIIFFIVIPTAASVFYLRLLSGLNQAFSKKDAREKLMTAKTPEELWSVVTKATRTTIS
jgi:mannitol/fructose-specific phosphotransferase system IIA component (Ntr-type)